MYQYGRNQYQFLQHDLWVYKTQKLTHRKMIEKQSKVCCQFLQTYLYIPFWFFLNPVIIFSVQVQLFTGSGNVANNL